jgi:ubiquinone/menaquinone biosynthesis C-methylase UbiE
MDDKYYNEGWFGRHPAVYEAASLLIGAIRRRAARMLGPRRLRVLDLATGTGALALAIARAGHEVVGVDLDPSMLARAHRKVKAPLALRFQHCDATRLPFADRAFQAATVSFAMHDVPFEVGIRMLREARRVLHPEGTLLIVDYNGRRGPIASGALHRIALLYESPNYRSFAERGIGTYLETTGFRVVRRSLLWGAVQFTRAR